MSNMKYIQLEPQGEIAVLRINRPEALNAMNIDDINIHSIESFGSINSQYSDFPLGFKLNIFHIRHCENWKLRSIKSCSKFCLKIPKNTMITINNRTSQ